jgi:hypothetical protein
MGRNRTWVKRMDNKFQQEIAITVLDKGLLALVLAIAGWWLNRSLELLKSSLSWSEGVLKEKLTVASKIMTGLNDLTSQHLNLLAAYCHDGAAKAEDVIALKESADKVDAACDEARLLFSPHTVSAVKQARELALSVILKRPSWLKQVTVTTKPGQAHDCGPDYQHEILALDKLIQGAITELQTEFPKPRPFSKAGSHNVMAEPGGSTGDMPTQ